MSVADIYEKRATFSFEVFPPKTDVGMEKLCGKDGVLDKLYTLEPDYISCTYGAGGTNVGKNLEVLDKIQKDGKCTPVTHFTCIGNTKEDIREKLQTYLDHGIDHMLALRGDLPFGWTGTNGDLHYATELVKFVRKEFGDKFTIAVAGSPEGHIACEDLNLSVEYLKQKQDAGASFFVTQLFFDNECFYRFRELADKAGITVPITAGIMPFMGKSQISRMVFMCGASLPSPVIRILAKYENDPESLQAAGVDYAARQLCDLKEHGADGLHLYTMNRPAIAATIMERLR